MSRSGSRWQPLSLTARPRWQPGYVRLSRAADGVRTRDLHLGKVSRYQLRYNRIATVPLQLSLYAMAGTDNRARAQSIDLLWFYSLCGHFHPEG